MEPFRWTNCVIFLFNTTVYTSKPGAGRLAQSSRACRHYGGKRMWAGPWNYEYATLQLCRHSFMQVKRGKWRRRLRTWWIRSRTGACGRSCALSGAMGQRLRNCIKWQVLTAWPISSENGEWEWPGTYWEWIKKTVRKNSWRGTRRMANANRGDRNSLGKGTSEMT